MIEKRTDNSWYREGPVATLLHVFRHGGLDQDQLQKIAADPRTDPFQGKVKAEPGHSFLHIITMGAGETYGPNTWADYFNKEARCHVSPGVGSVQLRGGLKARHGTFMEFGHVYRNHFNAVKGCDSPSGEIVWETFNDRMNRGELVVKVANDPWREQLQKIASGEPVYWSMGAGCDYDICSYCLNKAKGRKEYCEHLQKYAHDLMDNGIQVCAITDNPLLHDISEVPKPSDRIASTIQKVAYAGTHLVQDAESRMYVPARVVQKLATGYVRDRLQILEKLASCQGNHERVHEIPLLDDVGPELEDEIVEDLSPFPLEQVLSALQKQECMLPPRVFVRIVVRKPKVSIAGLGELRQALQGLYSQLRNSAELQDLLEDGTYLPLEVSPSGPSVSRVIQKHAAALAMSPESIQRRVLTIELSPRKVIQKQAAQPGPEAQYLAREYVKYQLGQLSRTVEPGKLDWYCQVAAKQC
jgi:hypothetical protein